MAFLPRLTAAVRRTLDHHAEVPRLQNAVSSAIGHRVLPAEVMPGVPKALYDRDGDGRVDQIVAFKGRGATEGASDDNFDGTTDGLTQATSEGLNVASSKMDETGHITQVFASPATSTLKHLLLTKLRDALSP